MKEISVLKVQREIAKLCIETNKTLPLDIREAVICAVKEETQPLAKEILKDIDKNNQVAAELDVPVCQDTGMAIVFLKIGQDVHLVDGDLYTAVNEGVRQGYEMGLLRKSVVSDPLERINTGDNTPAIIHTEIVPGDEIEITVAPKGFGSENMSRIYMLTPFDGRQGVINSVIDCVKKAGNNPCPPIVVGVGIGGDFEQCALLSKKALCRDITLRNEKDYYAKLEEELLEEINKLGIGPQGFGGVTTALAVNIETAPTHIAGLPVAVNIGCHITRHKTVRIV